MPNPFNPADNSSGVSGGQIIGGREPGPGIGWANDPYQQEWGAESWLNDVPGGRNVAPSPGATWQQGIDARNAANASQFSGGGGGGGGWQPPAFQNLPAYQPSGGMSARVGGFAPSSYGSYQQQPIEYEPMSFFNAVYNQALGRSPSSSVDDKKKKNPQAAESESGGSVADILNLLSQLGIVG